MGKDGHFQQFSGPLLTLGQGGEIVYSSPQFDQVRAATANFSAYSQDPKAATVVLYSSLAGTSVVGQVLFYDAPTPAPGIFDNFTNIPATLSDLKTRSYLDMVLSSNTSSSAGFR